VNCFEGATLKDKRSALFLTVLAGVFWGTSFPTIKIGLGFVNPYTFAFLRMLIASVLVLVISYATDNLTVSFARERLVWYLGLLNGLAYLIQYVGMRYTTASKSSLLVNLSAVWVPALSWLVLKERFSKKILLGIVSGLAGVFLVTTNLNLLEVAQGTILGDGLVSLSGIFWSFFIVYNKKLVDTHNALQFMPWIFVATTLPLIPFVLIPNNFVLLKLSLGPWIIIGYTAVFCWLVPYYLWVRGLKEMSPAVSTVILLIEVIVAIIISFFFLGETFTIKSGIGAVLIFLAIILVTFD
jgi:drug/metabolite transporter (DMT)-like permease